MVKSRPRFAAVWRVLFPREVRIPDSRDLVEEYRSRAAVLKGLYAGGLALLPVGGAVLFVTNLLYRVRGNGSLALAIILALPVSALAMILVLNLLSFSIFGAAVGLASVRGDLGLPDNVRSWAKRGLVFTVLLAFTLLPWPFFVLLVFAVYFFWRIEQLKKPVQITLSAWLISPDVPLDTRLRSLWNEGRWRRVKQGLEIEENPLFPRYLPRPYRSRAMVEIDKDIRDRFAAIAQARPVTYLSKIAATFASTAGEVRTRPRGRRGPVGLRQGPRCQR